MRHRFNQPNPKKRIHELFVDGKGELTTLVARKFNGVLEELPGTVDAEDMAVPTTPLETRECPARNTGSTILGVGGQSRVEFWIRQQLR